METTSFKGKGVLKWALSVGIIIVLNLFFAVAIQTLYPAPDYNDYCKQEQVRPAIQSEDECVAVGGQWNENLPSKDETVPLGYCNEFFTCSNDFQDAAEGYSQNVFVTLVVLGALSILAGYFVRVSPAVSAGLSYGGVLSFIIATMRYWDSAGDIIRLTIVALALIALITVGVKKFKE